MQESLRWSRNTSLGLGGATEKFVSRGFDVPALSLPASQHFTLFAAALEPHPTLLSRIEPLSAQSNEGEESAGLIRKRLADIQRNSGWLVYLRYESPAESLLEVEAEENEVVETMKVINTV